jgi:cysteinyl-tRNA synthetase
MSRKLLGNQIDVHTGGVDHIPVHHNNEIAQSEAVSGQRFVNYWMHNAHLMFEGKRFEKSSGHVIYLRQLIDRGYNPIALRYLLLGTKYSVEQNFTWDALDAASVALKKLQAFISANFDKRSSGRVVTKYKKRFNLAINDDLATPKALATLWELFKDHKVTDEDKVATILNFDTVLGLHLDVQHQSTEAKSILVTDAKIPQEVNDLLKERKLARESKDWSKADEARDAITKLGYKIVDDGGKQELVKV